MAISRLAQITRMLQKKRRFNPQYGRELLIQAAVADAEGASRRLASGKRLELAEKRQDIQKEQFAKTMKTRRKQFKLLLAEQKRATRVGEQQTRALREAQVKAAGRARIQDYIGMGLQAPISYLTVKELLRKPRY